MSKAKRSAIEVQGADITVLSKEYGDYISLTDMAKKFGDDVLIYSWKRNRNTLELIGIWEQIHNPNFKGLEFETFRKQAGLNSLSLTPRKWIEATGAIGFQSRAGRYGGGTEAWWNCWAEERARLLRSSAVWVCRSRHGRNRREESPSRCAADIRRGNFPAN